MKKNLWVLAPSGNISYFSRHKIAILKKILPEKPRKILEYGCGIGNNLYFIRQFFPDTQVWGCDTSEKSIEAARKQFPDIQFFLIPDRRDSCQQFDCVLVGDVIHHIPPNQRDYYMERIADYIRPGGHCVIFEHNPYNPLTRLLVSTCPFDAHAELITLRQMKDLLTTHRFKITDSKYCFYFPEFLERFNCFEDCLSKIPFGGKYYVLAIKNP
ncbi:MAG TPA: class I SAM-dependent methyltransferase [Methanoregula sp.]|nr:class I SAM-dependent methyltransferase [Methanoregula sp.]